jgi:hypothetical protein
MSVAILMGGNLGCYKHTIDSVMNNIIKPNNADVFILTSKNNYIHAGTDNFDCINIEVPVSKEDEENIKKCFGENLKYFEYIENISGYNDSLISCLNNLKNNISWINITENHIERFNKNTKTIDDGVRYIDRYLRLQYLIKLVDKYDFIMVVRIDQMCYTTIKIESVENNVFYTNTMDNLFYGSKNIMREICLNFVNEIGLYDDKNYIDRYNNGIDYRLTPEVQFSKFIIKTLSKLNTIIIHNNIKIGWILLRKNEICIIPDYYNAENNRKQMNIEKDKYYKFDENKVTHDIIFDMGYTTIWIYYIYR